MIWRGALGGVVGAPFVSVALMIQEYVRLGYVPYSGVLEIAALPIFGVIGLVVGLVIGIILWLLVSWLGAARFNFFVRAIVGAIFFGGVLVVWQSVLSGRNNGLVPPTAMEVFFYIVIYTTAFGILPAIFARPVGEEEFK